MQLKLQINNLLAKKRKNLIFKLNKISLAWDFFRLMFQMQMIYLLEHASTIKLNQKQRAIKNWAIKILQLLRNFRKRSKLFFVCFVLSFLKFNFKSTQFNRFQGFKEAAKEWEKIEIKIKRKRKKPSVC